MSNKRKGNLRYDLCLTPVFEFDLDILVPSFGRVFEHKAIFTIKFDWFACEEVFLDVGHQVFEVFVDDVLSEIEQHVGWLFMQLTLTHFLTRHVVISVPFLVKLVLDKTYIVAEA